MNMICRYKIGKSLYFITLFLFMFSLVLTRIGSRASNIAFICVLLSFLAGTVFLSIGSVQISTDNTIQLCFIVWPITLFWLLTLRKSIIHQMPYHYIIAYSGSIILILASMLLLKVILLKVLSVQNIFKKFSLYCKENFYLILIFIIYLVCYIPCFFLLFKSDSNVYYLSIVKNQGTWNFTLNDLSCFQMGGHLSYGYSLYVFLGNYLIRIWGIGIRLINLIFIFISIFCVNDIIKNFFKQKNGKFYAFLVCLFTFNPLILGIIQELNLDMPMTCFFIWFVWAFIRKKHIFIVFFSGLLCFSKEVGIILLAGFVIGTFFYRLIHINKKLSLKKFVQCYNLYEWLISYGAILFMINMVVLNTQWGEKSENIQNQVGMVNTFQVNPQYILIKLQHMLILNFQWVIIPIVIAFFISFIIYRKKIITDEAIAGVIFSFIFFLTFQFLYFTYPHYRYLQVNAFFYMILIGGMLDYMLPSSRGKIFLCSIIAILFLVQSFYSIDIISNSMFRTVSVGKGEIFSLAYYGDKPNEPYILWSEKDGADLRNEKFRDYVQNNRQYLGFEYCFERLLEKINYDESIALVLSPIYSDNYWGDEGWTIVNMFGIYDKHLLHWNSFWKQITYEPEDLPLNLISIDSVRNDQTMYKTIWYIELPDTTKQNVIPYNYDIKDKITVDYGIWLLNAYEVEIID